MTQTAGAIRAADQIRNGTNGGMSANTMADIIDEETHAAEMLAFVEKVAAWDWIGDDKGIEQAQTEAFALLKKVRG